jgi:hypothetical protein
MTDSKRYALSYPAVSGDVVTQGHADHCAAYGHATHTVDGVLSPFCPRCGESTARRHYATPEQIELIVADQRSGGFLDDETEAEVLEYVWDTLALPGQDAMGAYAIVPDGSALSDAYLAFLTTRNPQVPEGEMHLVAGEHGVPLCWTNRPLPEFATYWATNHIAAVDCPVCARLISFASTL